jgi:hypothetical protein
LRGVDGRRWPFALPFALGTSLECTRQRMLGVESGMGCAHGAGGECADVAHEKKTVQRCFPKKAAEGSRVCPRPIFMSDARPLLVVGMAMLTFGAINTYIGTSLLGERGLENRVRACTAQRAHCSDTIARPASRLRRSVFSRRCASCARHRRSSEKRRRRRKMPHRRRLTGRKRHSVLRYACGSSRARAAPHVQHVPT